MQNEIFERELQNTSINDVSLADYVKENYVPMSVIEEIKAEIMNERDDIACGIMAKYSSDEAYYNALGWALNIIDKHCGKENE